MAGLPKDGVCPGFLHGHGGALGVKDIDFVISPMGLPLTGISQMCEIKDPEHQQHHHKQRHVPSRLYSSEPMLTVLFAMM